MPYDNTFMPEFKAPERMRMLVYEGYDICAASAILNQRSTGRGIQFLTYDPSMDKIASFWISRKHLYEPEIKDMFSDPAWQSIRLNTRIYDMRSFFCVVIPDPIDDIFYTMQLPYTAISPSMSNKELQAVIDAAPKQDAKGQPPGRN